MNEKMSPFEIASCINEKKGVLEADEVGYNSFIINKVYSNTADSIMFANEMNRYWSLSPQQQFDFYYYGLPKKRRYGKWNKCEDDEKAIQLIQEYYGFSRRKAKEVVHLVRPNLKDIAMQLDKGGRNNVKKK